MMMDDGESILSSRLIAKLFRSKKIHARSELNKKWFPFYAYFYKQHREHLLYCNATHFLYRSCPWFDALSTAIRYEVSR